jgi:hypothetical protein
VLTQGLGTGSFWLLGLVSALLFVSEFVHELAHARVAGARGLRDDHAPVSIAQRLATGSRRLSGPPASLYSCLIRR